jgi:alpha-N-arabinofuranosidase
VQYDAGVYQFKGIELPRVDAVAARDASGKVWLALTNLDAVRPASIEASMPGVKTAHGETLSAPKVDSVNTFEAPAGVTPKKSTVKVSGGKVSVRLPPASVTVLSLE